MTRYIEVNITADRVTVRGNLAEFEATALLQDAIEHQSKQRAATRERVVKAFICRYHAAIFYPILAAFVLGLSISFAGTTASQSIQSHPVNYERY